MVPDVSFTTATISVDGVFGPSLIIFIYLDARRLLDHYRTQYQCYGVLLYILFIVVQGL